VARGLIAGGEPVTEGKLVLAGTRGFMAAVLQPGTRAVSVPISATSAVSGFIYAGEYSGYISRWQEGTGQYRDVTIYPHNMSGHGAEDGKYRFQWTAPIATSPHDKNVLYHGAQVLLRTTDHGVHWDAISGDLTRNDKSKQKWAGGPLTGDNTGVELRHVFTIAESPAPWRHLGRQR
jgi:hypothetical protein